MRQPSRINEGLNSRERDLIPLKTYDSWLAEEVEKEFQLTGCDNPSERDSFIEKLITKDSQVSARSAVDSQIAGDLTLKG